MVQKAPFPNARFVRLIYATIVVTGMVLPCLVDAQIWRCSQGYTNQPEGKTNCTPAGAVETCGSDGNTYLTPRKAGEAPLSSKCRGGSKGLNPFADMSQVQAAKFGDTRQADSHVVPKKLAAHQSNTNTINSLPIPELGFDMKDLFSCSRGGKDLQGCSLADIRQFIEQSFNNMSSILNQ